MAKRSSLYRQALLLLIIVVGVTVGTSAQLPRPNRPREFFTALNGIRFADQFPGATVGAQIDNCLADISIFADGTCIIPASMGAGAPANPVAGRHNLIDLRGGNTNFGSLNDVRIVDGNKFVTIQEAVEDLPSLGGTVMVPDGSRTISSTVTISKPVTLLLGHGTYTLSASPSFDFQQGSVGSALIGKSIGSSTDGGTRLIASAGTVTPMIRIKGAVSPKAGRILIQDMHIEGVFTPTQLGIEMDNANGVYLNRISFRKLGQAEDMNFVQEIHHNKVLYLSCGSGDTAATACVRLENRSNPGFFSERISWIRSDWEVDPSDENGMALFVGNDVTNVWINNSFMSLEDSTTARVVTIERATNVRFNLNIISSQATTTATIDVTGTGAEDSTGIQFYGNNVTSLTAGIPAIRFDFTTKYVVAGGQLTGGSNGTALIQMTANAGQGYIGPTQPLSTGGDTLLSDASGLATVFYATGPTAGGRWESSNIIPFISGRALGSSADPAQRWNVNADDINVTRVFHSTNITFTDLDTTPDVSGSNFFTEANTGATTITNFDGGAALQRITILFTTADTTIQDGANIQLAGGANFVGSVNDTLELFVVGTVWREKTRSVN